MPFLRTIFSLGAVLIAGCGPSAGEEDTPLNDPELLARLSEVESLGYVGGVRPAEGVEDSVRVHDADRAWAGYNLVISHHQPEAMLMDMDGRAVHVWRKPLDEVWSPETLAQSSELKRWIPTSPDGFEERDSWHCAYLMPDGGLVALYKDIGLAAIDRDSNLLWSRLISAHHDLDVAEDGRLFVIAGEPRIMPRIHPEEPQLDDLIAILTPTGEDIRTISIHDALANSEFDALLDECNDRGDPFHTNSIEILRSVPKTDPPLPAAFQPGALLVSVRELDLIGLIDPESGVFTWVRTGPWRAQHDARLIDSGVITLFDNRGHNSPYGFSRGVDFDPVAGEIVWQYGGNENNRFYSARRGNMQRLPNGNSLLNESGEGRAFEVTPEGEIVWEYINTLREGEEEELIAEIRRIERYAPEFVAPLLNR